MGYLFGGNAAPDLGGESNGWTTSAFNDLPTSLSEAVERLRENLRLRLSVLSADVDIDSP
jgi:hypothetical protein